MRLAPPPGKSNSRYPRKTTTPCNRCCHDSPPPTATVHRRAQPIQRPRARRGAEHSHHSDLIVALCTFHFLLRRRARGRRVRCIRRCAPQSCCTFACLQTRQRQWVWLVGAGTESMPKGASCKSQLRDLHFKYTTSQV